MNGLRYVIGGWLLFTTGSYGCNQFDGKNEYLEIRRDVFPSDEVTPEYENDVLRTKPIIIPIGSNCFQARVLRTIGLRFLAYPFDWNITSLSAIYRLIENDFEGFCDKKCYIRQGLRPVFDERYRIFFPHDFHVKEHYDDAEFQDDLERTIRRYEKRIARFYKAIHSGQPVCFIRATTGAVYSYFPADAQITKDWAENFVALLKRKFPKLIFTLICSDYTGEINGHWGVANCVNFYYDLTKWTPDFVSAENDWKGKLIELGFGG